MAVKRTKRAYLHGYSRQEQDRLYRQARFLEPKVYEKVDFSSCTRVLEVGCGVGAQTAILLERFGHLKIDSVDAAETQIARAKEYLARPISEKRVTLHVGQAQSLPFADNTFDGAFVCWFLEHLNSPLSVLSEVRRVLRPGGVIFCNEVLNSTFFIDPYSPATLKYWFVFNDHQWNLGGDPFVGAKLGNFLLAAGFQNIASHVCSFHYDNRSPKMRTQMIEYWTEILLSGTPELVKQKLITTDLVDEMKKELALLKKDPNAVLFDSWIQASGEVY
jgi:ubiquinone/menaquinone biosynthesis C-methylase UbiE